MPAEVAEVIASLCPRRRPSSATSLGPMRGPGERHARRAVAESSNVLRIVRMRRPTSKPRPLPSPLPPLQSHSLPRVPQSPYPARHSCLWPPWCCPIGFSVSVRPKTDPLWVAAAAGLALSRTVARGMPHLILNPFITGPRSRLRAPPLRDDRHLARPVCSRGRRPHG